MPVVVPNVESEPAMPGGVFEGHYAVAHAADQSGPGQWTITEFNGAPLVPGTYTIQVDAPGYVLTGERCGCPWMAMTPIGIPFVWVPVRLATARTKRFEPL